MKKKSIILTFLMILILLAINALAERTIVEKRFPTIVVEFDQQVRNITLYKLTDSNQNNIELDLVNRSLNNQVFKFKPRTPLADGDYTFTIEAENYYGVINTSVKEFTVQMLPIRIWLVQPRFNYTSTPSVDIIVETSRETTCRWYQIEANYSNMHDFDSTDGTQHTKNNFPVLESGSNFYVKCYDTELNQIPSAVFRLFYLPPPRPVITITAIPNPVTENPLQTEVIATSNDAVVCKYSTYAQTYEQMQQVFSGFNEDDPSAYKKEHKQVMSNLLDGHNYTYFVACKNLAGRVSDIVDVTVEVNSNAPAQINVISPMNNSMSRNKNVIFKISTNKKATCSYGPNQNAGLTSGSFGNTGYSHESNTLSFNEGRYTYYFKCDFYPSSGGIETKTSSVTFTINVSACNSGEKISCGPLNHTGVCRTGNQTCQNGDWGICTGAVSPSAESCDGLDNDCNGLVDDIPGGCVCTPGNQRACGPSNIGICHPGRQNCQSNHIWGSCIGAIYPSNEVCDGSDNDCDGAVDEGCQCTPQGNTRLCGPANWTIGVCSPGTQICEDSYQWGVCVGAVYPSNETCDGSDNDCDGSMDEGCQCVPADQRLCGPLNNTGECTRGTQTCQSSGLWGLCNGATHPMPEICDNKDNNCNTKIDDGLGSRSVSCGVGACLKTVGQSCSLGSWLPSCVPGTSITEACGDGIDNDCDGLTDESCSCTPAGQTRTCGPLTDTGECSFGLQACQTNLTWGACVGAVYPVAEVCDNKDNDCNGLIDDNVPSGCACTPGDRRDCGPSTDIGECVIGTQTCQGNRLWGSCAGAVYPVAEVCDNKDNDCDGSFDEGCSCMSGQSRQCGPDASIGECHFGSQSCVNGIWTVCVGAVLPSNETCDGLDNDCDNSTDEGCQCSPPGQSRVCGPSNEVGICRFGSQSCVSGSWSLCVGAVLPSNDSCDGSDNDCDGAVDESCLCSPPGRTQRCGPLNETGVCRFGSQSCVNGLWGDCAGDVLPSVEICDDKDNDCDGAVDDGCQCSPPGQTRSCGPLNETGVCRFGSQSCTNGLWGGCVGDVLPSVEICNGKDDDCNNRIDDGLTNVTSCGVGVCLNTVTQTCSAGVWGPLCVAGAASPEICDGRDNNCDGLVDETCNCTVVGQTRSCGPLNNTGVCRLGLQSCQVNKSWSVCVGAVLPSNEVCDGLDNDCSGVVDDSVAGGCVCSVVGQTRSCGPLSDIGECVIGTQTCQGNHLWGACAGAVYPAAEVCDNKDNDCDGSFDEGCSCMSGQSRLCGPDAAVGVCVFGSQYCLNDVWGICTGAIYPSNETCDGKDNDCDGAVDDGCQCSPPGKKISCGPLNNTGVCRTGNQTCVNGLWGGCVGKVLPSVEICDNSDNDCNGVVDNLSKIVSCGVGVCSRNVTQTCTAGSWGPACVPGNAGIEVCNGLDDDCDNSVDDGLTKLDSCGVGVCSRNVSQSCSLGSWLPACVAGTADIEVCNGLDDDCNGSIDEGCQCTPPGIMRACGPSSQMGVCRFGSQSCANGSWSMCVDAVIPSNEVCDGLDNDCDNSTDEGCPCTPPGRTQSCGPLNETGICRFGSQTCSANGWGTCNGAVYPSNDSCDGLDNDCDGAADEGCPCSSTGQTRSCGPLNDTGECTYGTQTCQNNHVWSPCIGATYSVPETCDGKDNDCDNSTDEGMRMINNACCGDGVNEYYGYKKGIHSGSRYINWADNTNDKACCNNQANCVLSNICRSAGTLLSGLNPGGVDNIAECGSSGLWLDIDGAPLSCIAHNLGMAAAGEPGVGEYGSSTNGGDGVIECCGDDAREYLIVGTNGTEGCCNMPTKCVNESGGCTICDLTLQLIQPRFGYTTNSTTDVIIRTNRAVNCRWHPTNQAYGAMFPFTSSGTTTHTKKDVVFLLPTSHFYVKCNDTALSKIASAHFVITYNPVKPVITAGAYPSLVTDITDQQFQTEIIVYSDQRVVCKYDDLAANYTDMGRKFPLFNESDESAHMTEHHGIISGLSDNTKYKYFVACKNMGGLISNAVAVEFEVNSSAPARVDVVSPTNNLITSNKNIEFHVQTNKRATCFYGATENTTGYSGTFGSTGYKHLSNNIVFNDGAYKYYFKCEFYLQSGEQETARASVNFMVDNTTPSRPLVNDTSPFTRYPEYSIYLNQLYGKWKSYDNLSGIKGYSYRILDYQNNTVMGEGYVTEESGWMPVSTSLVDKRKYYFSVIAENGAGLWSENGTSDGVTIDVNKTNQINDTNLTPTCSDGLRNQNETDIDCGGPCSGCVKGKSCVRNSDCKTDLTCTNGICTELDKCSNNRFDLDDETDIDCGGRCIIKGKTCGLEKACEYNSDCTSGYCYQQKCIDKKPPTACVNGETSDCMDEVCEGTKTCTNNVWGMCVKTDPNCNPEGPPEPGGMPQILKLLLWLIILLILVAGLYFGLKYYKNMNKKPRTPQITKPAQPGTRPAYIPPLLPKRPEDIKREEALREKVRIEREALKKAEREELFKPFEVSGAGMKTGEKKEQQVTTLTKKEEEKKIAEKKETKTKKEAKKITKTKADEEDIFRKLREETKKLEDVTGKKPVKPEVVKSKKPIKESEKAATKKPVKETGTKK